MEAEVYLEETNAKTQFTSRPSAWKNSYYPSFSVGPELMSCFFE